MKHLHLICNAHIDPCWQWEWEEGAAAAMSTFRTAAELCEQFGGFVFNHNEVILYKWVEEHEPELFQRIQRLVADGQWHIMGGWYVQPDCNMPSGESFVRQALLGKRYFARKFGVEPTTAINLDPFGHTRGIVQILKKANYDSYLICRPGESDCPLPATDFTWVGYDGSEIVCHRTPYFYNSALGKAREKVEGYLKQSTERAVGLVLWGVGDHGGGPSHRDLADLADLMENTDNVKVIHSTPERYFAELKAIGMTLPRHEGDLNPWAVGCYTSQIRVKQRHRQLENALYMLEKMASNAAVQCGRPYPYTEINQAFEALLTTEFHDMLPGTCVQPVEETTLRLMDYALEIAGRLRARAFYQLASGQPKARDGEIPILVYNPHPFPVRTVIECEVQLAEANFAAQFTAPIVHQNGRRLPCQTEKEFGNVNVDWRKRAVFLAELGPSRMNRFDCVLEVLPERPSHSVRPQNGAFTFTSDALEVIINGQTGLMDGYSANDVSFLRQNAFAPLVMNDNSDPWGMVAKGYRDLAGRFRLMSPERGARFSGVEKGTLDSVRVIEEGEVRTVIEALLEYGDSFLVLTYHLPKRGTEVEVHVRVFWNEKQKMLKLSVPTVLEDGLFLGQVAYGVDELPADGNEAVCQKWLAVVSERQNRAVTCINDGIYGADFVEGEVRLSLLRSPVYAGHPIGDRPIAMQDRFTPHIDQGERFYRFRLNGGDAGERLEHIDREALVNNERPFALSFFPSGTGKTLKGFVTLSDEAVQLTALKKAEDTDDLIVRLFEPTGRARSTTIAFPTLDIEQCIELGAFELKTLRLEIENRKLVDTDLLER